MQVRGLVERPLRFYRPLLSSLAVQWKLWAGPDDQARVLQDQRWTGSPGVSVPDGDKAFGHPPLWGQELPGPLAGSRLGEGEYPGACIEPVFGSRRGWGELT